MNHNSRVVARMHGPWRFYACCICPGCSCNGPNQTESAK
jgi:hypothetical protein